MTSPAKTPTEYLKSLPADRRAELDRVRQVVLKHLPKGYEETMQYGMIAYVVPHSIYPAGYHCDPTKALQYASLAAQKSHLALHLMSVYGDKEIRAWFEKAFKASGKKLDMGAACLRFKRADDLPLDVIGAAIAKVSVKDYIASVEKILSTRRSAKPSKPGTAKPRVAKKKAGQ